MNIVNVVIKNLKYIQSISLFILPFPFSVSSVFSVVIYPFLNLFVVFILLETYSREENKNDNSTSKTRRSFNRGRA